MLMNFVPNLLRLVPSFSFRCSDIKLTHYNYYTYYSPCTSIYGACLLYWYLLIYYNYYRCISLV